MHTSGMREEVIEDLEDLPVALGAVVGNTRSISPMPR
jgi:hypothetical protein